MSNDPHKEPENSTVDNWMGQEVNKDAELADRLLQEKGGDEAAAEQAFESQSEGAEPDPGEVKRANGEGYA
ncbi:MAG TPA: hypothetical protein VM345_13180 [Acidimicrobiales bacterium]|nr:hypothetical protein [Acidimicrobiales bacterium]